MPLPLPPAVVFYFSIRRLSPAAFRLLAVFIKEHCTNAKNPSAMLKAVEAGEAANIPAYVGPPANGEGAPATEELIEAGILKQQGESLLFTEAMLARFATKESETEKAFDAFWAAYPSKNSKQNALKAYKKAVQAGVKPETMIKALPGYINYLKETGIAAAYAASWINGRRWEDPHSNPEGQVAKKLTLSLMPSGNAEYDELWERVMKTFIAQYRTPNEGLVRVEAWLKNVFIREISGGLVLLGVREKNPRYKINYIERNMKDILTACFNKEGIPAPVNIELQGVVL